MLVQHSPSSRPRSVSTASHPASLHPAQPLTQHSPSSNLLAGSDLESHHRPRPHLPVPLMHRAGAACCRWGQQPPARAAGQRPLHRAGARPSL